MSLTHITSHSIRRLLTLTEKKEQLLKGIEEVENEIAKALKGAATSVVEAAETVTPFKPSKKSKGKKTRKAKASKPGGLKDRILALLQDAGDQGLRVKEIAEKLASKPAKAKKQPKKKKSGLTPEGRAKLAANMKARWAARKAGKPAVKVRKPAKKGFKLPKKA